MFEVNITISLKGFKVNDKGFMQCEDAALSISTKADNEYVKEVGSMVNTLATTFGPALNDLRIPNDMKINNPFEG